MNSPPVRVLLIEDDEDDYVLTRDLLTEIDPHGFALEWVRTYDGARAALVGRRHDVYLIDYRLGERSGLELLDAAAACGCDAPIIVLTGQGNREVDLAAMQAGATSYLAKAELNAPLLERTIRYACELKRADRSLRDSEARTRAVLENAVDGMITIDAHGRIESFNPAAEHIFGYRSAEVIGQNVRLLMPPPYNDAHDDFLAHYLHTGKRRVIGVGREATGRRKDGTTFPLDLCISEMSVAGERIFLGITRDITERKRAEETVRELQEQAQHRQRLADIGAITAQIVHDIGNPLAGISMQTQLLLRRADRDGTQPLGAARQALERILGEVRRLDLLVKEFLEFSREQRLDLRSIDVHRFLKDLVDLWQPVTAARGIALTLEPPKGLPAVTADEDKLRRVFENLVKNATDAIAQGPGEIALRTLITASAAVRISVEDTGPGMPPHIQPFRLFETTKPHGTGLGLAIAQQIVAAHGGRIEFAPRQPHGTIFHVELPLLQERAKPRHPDLTTPSARRRKESRGES